MPTGRQNLGTTRVVVKKAHTTRTVTISSMTHAYEASGSVAISEDGKNTSGQTREISRAQEQIAGLEISETRWSEWLGISEVANIDLKRTTSSPELTTFIGRSLLEETDKESSNAEERDINGAEAIEVIGSEKAKKETGDLVRAVKSGVRAGYTPELQKQGMAGSYSLKDADGNKVAIFKPVDEEAMAPNNPRGFVGRQMGERAGKGSIRVGEAALREVAAYTLDGGFSGVPRTALVRLGKECKAKGEKYAGLAKPPEGREKVGSLQEYVHNSTDCGELGPSLLPAQAVHRVGLLDLLLLNSDRHTGNLLVTGEQVGGRISTESGGLSITPIDHGMSLPEALDPPFFEWQHWRQCSIPFSSKEANWVLASDAEELRRKLKESVPGLKESVHKVIWTTLTAIRHGIRLGLTLFELASVFTRPIDVSKSPLEVAVLEATSNADSADEVCDEDGEAGVAGECADDLGGGSSDDEFQFDMEEVGATPPAVEKFAGVKSQLSRYGRHSETRKVLAHCDEEEKKRGMPSSIEPGGMHPCGNPMATMTPAKPVMSQEGKDGLPVVSFELFNEETWSAFQGAFPRAICTRLREQIDARQTNDKAFASSLPVQLGKAGALR